MADSDEELQKLIAEAVKSQSLDGVFMVCWRRGEDGESRVREILYAVRKGLEPIDQAFVLRSVEGYRHLVVAADALQDDVEIGPRADDPPRDAMDFS